MRKTPINDLFNSLCARVFSRPAAILKTEKTLGTRLNISFICFITNTGSAQYYTKFSVAVFFCLDVLFFSFLYHFWTLSVAYKGTEVLFRCRATGYPKPVYTWRKGKIPVSSLDSLRIQILSNGDLKISDITEDDDDIYTCTSTNWVGPMDNRRARLSVIAPISVSVSPTNIAVNSEEDVKVTCVAAGVPKPTVEWYKGENLLTSQNRVQVTDTELVISKVQTSDSGYYTCRAYHDYGANNAKVYLNVIKKEGEATCLFHNLKNYKCVSAI